MAEESFESALSELTVNSKPHINMLTMLAEDSLEFAPLITDTVLTHLQKVSPEVKLPVLYLIDSIVKNVGKAYLSLFNEHIAECFATTFEQVDEKTREQMFKLRTTWDVIFTTKTLNQLDSLVHAVDPAWPVAVPKSSVYLNPKFFTSPVATSSADSTSMVKAAGDKTATGLQTKMIEKQKMLLELQRKKLKLELLQTQAQLEEQQKQLEKNLKPSITDSLELQKLHHSISEHESKLKQMSKNLKKQMQLNSPKLQEIHRVTSDMKAQSLAEANKLTIGPETLVKPAALLELKDDVKYNKLVKSVVTKTKHPLVAGRQKQLVAADSTEDVAPPPVRIAPVSSQLINAALSGRITRDPRIRNRYESSITNAALQPPPPPPPTTTASSAKRSPSPALEAKSNYKSRKDKKSNSQSKEKSPKAVEEHHKGASTKHADSTKYHTRSSSRSSDKSPSKNSSKSEKSPSRKYDERNSKRSKLEGLFSPPNSPVENKRTSKIHSPSKSNSKKEHLSPLEIALPKVTKRESSPKKLKQQDISSSQEKTSIVESNDIAGLPVHKLKLDIEKSQSSIQTKTEEEKLSPESENMDNSAEMLDEDIENIVKNPSIIRPMSKTISKVPESIDEDEEAMDDANAVVNFDEIIRNPTKQPKIDKINVFVNNESHFETNKLTSIDKDGKENLFGKEPVKNKDIPDSVVNLKNNNLVEDPSINYHQTLINKELHTIDKSKVDLEESKVTTEPIVKENVQPLKCITSKHPNIDEQHVKLSLEEVDDHKLQTKEKDLSLDLIVETRNITGFTESSNDVIMKSPEKPVSTLDHPMLQLPLPQHPDIADVNIPKCNEILEKAKQDTSVTNPVTINEAMEIAQDTCVNTLPLEKEISQHEPVLKNIEKLNQDERKQRKTEKPSIMEQVITDAEKHESSPSPPPPPEISDKFKEIKQSSLSRLRRVGRPREDNEGTESPEPADVDLRTQIALPPVTEDLKNEVLGLAEKDVDLRNLPSSPSKKRPSMENVLDGPPSKKSKPGVIDELFGSEDVDLRPVLCPPIPSPPPPPMITPSSTQENSGESLWARYKQTKPDTYKSKYTPSRRDRGPSVDRYSRNNRFSGPDGGNSWKSRNRTYSEDIDMRAQPPNHADSSYNHIIMQALEQHKRGELNTDGYKRVLSEVFSMNEKKQLEEAQRRDAEESAQAESLDPISDEEITGDKGSGAEDTPSLSDSSSGSGTEDSQKPYEKRKSRRHEKEAKGPETLGDTDIRVTHADVDVRTKTHEPRLGVDGKSSEERSSRKARGGSPYRRRSEKEKYRSRREEMRAHRRGSRNGDEESDRSLRHRQRYNPETRESVRSPVPSESMEVDAPRVPPLPYFEDGRTFRDPVLPHPPRFDHPDQRHSPPLRPTVWDQQRLAGPSPWLPGVTPQFRGPHPVGVRSQDRFMPPRWQPPMTTSGGFEGDPRSGHLSVPRFNRFAPPPGGRFQRPLLLPYEVPPADPSVLKLIEEDPTTTIDIDGFWPDIRFYGHIAVALMSWDDPIEISFRPESGARRVTIDERDSFVVHFGAPPVEIIIDGHPHRVKFGAPTRELYIDNKWYHILFGGPPVTCDIGGRPHTVKLEGPLPSVLKGGQRKDLVAGKVNLIIDAEHMTPVFLDAKPQKFEVNGIAYIIRFVEALQKTIINGVAFKSEFGGIPRPIILNGRKHFFRLTILPPGVVPGFLTIVNMEGGRLPSPPNLPAPPQLPATLEQVMSKPDFLPPPPFIPICPPTISPEVIKRDSEVTPTHPPALPPIVSTAPLLPPTIPAVNPLDMLSTLMPTPEATRAGNYSYSADNKTSDPSVSLPTTTGTDTSTTTSVPVLTGEINVTELLQKLMATGIVPTLDQTKDKVQEKPTVSESAIIKPVDFHKPETLKTRQTALIANLYSGIQCNSCGVRFPPEQTMKYSQHLDWHFRQNRRDKDSTRTAQSRRYYYDVNDWVQFEEIEDLEERAQPWFETQDGEEDEELLPKVVESVRAADYPEEAACEICHDKFESFYNDEKEEWHLRNAVDHDGKLVHPLCLEDQKAAANKPIVVDDIDITEDEPKEEKKEEEEEKDKEKPTKEEDDDIMEVMDIEFVKPVFPVEDLTVSDSESVVDNNEEKPDIEEELKDVEMKDDENVEEPPEISDVVPVDTNNDSQDEGEKDESDKVEENEDEVVEDNIVLSDKGEDSILSAAEILEVVRNIKKDPDALGGEYEELGTDEKKEKGEIPVPEPVVDTTHASVVCSIDGNVELEETPQPVGGPPKIKINITKPVVQLAPKEVKEIDCLETPDSDTSNSMLVERLALNTQPPPPGEEPVPHYIKPKLLGRKMQELPVVVKGNELSGLCSIM